MAEQWIELEKGRTYKVIGGGKKGDSGLCLEVRNGIFGRSWGRVALVDAKDETWIRASHLHPVHGEPKLKK